MTPDINKRCKGECGKPAAKPRTSFNVPDYCSPACYRKSPEFRWRGKIVSRK